MIQLVRGGCYRAKVKLSWGENLVASNAGIEDKLVAAGFRNVQVLSTGRLRPVTGIWNGEECYVDPASLDDHLVDVERVT